MNDFVAVPLNLLDFCSDACRFARIVEELSQKSGCPPDVLGELSEGIKKLFVAGKELHNFSVAEDTIEDAQEKKPARAVPEQRDA